MENMLRNYYHLSSRNPMARIGKNTYQHEEWVYSIMNIKDKEVLYDEQAMLAEFCFYNGYEHIMCIIPNVYGEWITSYQDEEYVVSKGKMNIHQEGIPQGQILANFHRINQTYPYEPSVVSNYGKWKQLWIEKLTAFEQQMNDYAKQAANPFYESVMNTLPYIIGISENAIQYIQESEEGGDYSLYDRGTITFHRYYGQLKGEFVNFTELSYDQPIRDVAEYLRLLLREKDGVTKGLTFLLEYDSVFPISLFSWRLLYARLLFPIHFFDFIDEQIINFDYLRKLKENQVQYEKNIKLLFETIERKYKRLPFPMIQWL